MSAVVCTRSSGLTPLQLSRQRQRAGGDRVNQKSTWRRSDAPTTGSLSLSEEKTPDSQPKLEQVGPPPARFPIQESETPSHETDRKKQSKAGERILASENWRSRGPKPTSTYQPAKVEAATHIEAKTIDAGSPLPKWASKSVATDDNSCDDNDNNGDIRISLSTPQSSPATTPIRHSRGRHNHVHQQPRVERYLYGAGGARLAFADPNETPFEGPRYYPSPDPSALPIPSYVGAQQTKNAAEFRDDKLAVNVDEIEILWGARSYYPSPDPSALPIPSYYRAQKTKNAIKLLDDLGVFPMPPLDDSMVPEADEILFSMSWEADFAV